MAQPQVVEADVNGPASRTESRPAPLSRRLWDLDWSRVLPWSFDGSEIHHGSFDEALPFMSEHYPTIFGSQEQSSRFLVERMTPAKRRFGDEMDTFLFRVGGELVGVFMGHPSDWSTYYLRTTAILPEYRRRHLFSQLVERICASLRDAGVARVEADVSPSNAPIVRLLLNQGFLAGSTVASERWGVSMRFTKFLCDDAKAIFVRQYCILSAQ